MVKAKLLLVKRVGLRWIPWASVSRLALRGFPSLHRCYDPDLFSHVDTLDKGGYCLWCFWFYGCVWSLPLPHAKCRVCEDMQVARCLCNFPSSSLQRRAHCNSYEWVSLLKSNSAWLWIPDVLAGTWRLSLSLSVGGRGSGPGLGRRTSRRGTRDVVENKDSTKCCVFCKLLRKWCVWTCTWRVVQWFRCLLMRRPHRSVGWLLKPWSKIFALEIHLPSAIRVKSFNFFILRPSKCNVQEDPGWSMLISGMFVALAS